MKAEDLGLTAGKILIVFALLVFFVIALLALTDDDNMSIFVDGDKVSENTLSIGSVASTADTYEFAPGETMNINMVVTNNMNQEYDFSATVWEETSLGSKDIEVFKADPVTLDEGEPHTFSTDITVPFEPGTYYYSTVSYYSPVGVPEFSVYDDGTYFTITVLDIAPVSTPTPEATSTPDLDDTTAPGVTETPGITTPVTDYTDDENPITKIFSDINLEDENTKILFGAAIFGAIMAVGLFVINKRRKK